MSELIEACENGHDHDNNPIAFELNRIANPSKLNTQIFSRLRDTLSTSGTVMG